MQAKFHLTKTFEQFILFSVEAITKRRRYSLELTAAIIRGGGFMYDEFPNCPRCHGDHPNDGPVCGKCQREIDLTDGWDAHHDLRDDRAFFAGRGPDEDGEEFHPMTDEEMAFAQARWEFELSTPEGAKYEF